MRVLAKTTGDRPEYILPDGHIVPIRRIGPARIKEHIRTLDKAATLGVEALVVEGMALQAETVYLSERILQATHAVIANTRPDHAETMGAGREGVLQTLRQMIPLNGKLFTCSEAGAAEIKAGADEKGTPCVVVSAPLTAQAPAVARILADALPAQGSGSHCQKTSSFSIFSPPLKIEALGMPVHVYDFFSANDVVSSELLIEHCPLPPDFYNVALVSTRADRPLRTRAFMNWIAAQPRFDAIAVTGSHTGYALLSAWSGAGRHRLFRVLPWVSPERLILAIVKKARAREKRGATVTALGNVHGYGEKWRQALSQGHTQFSPSPAHQTNKEKKHAD